MDYQDIKTNISGLEYVKELKITQGYNQHGKLYLTGLLKEENIVKYYEAIKSIKNIEVYIQGETKKYLFTGIVQEINLKHQGAVYSIKIEGISYSYLMDLNKRSCSFQDINISYHNLFKEVIALYEGEIKDDISEGKTIEKLIVQYEETDWEFLIRLASHFYRGIYPDITFKEPYIVLGIEEGDTVGILESHDFNIKKNVNQIRNFLSSDNTQIKEADVIDYKMETYEDFPLGGIVLYQDKSLYIKSKEARIEKGYLIFCYSLTTKEGFTVEKTWNHNMIGLALKGRVMDVKNDKVKVALDIDKALDKGSDWEFLYTTLYAPKEGAGWYCMPRKGDWVHVYFPSKEEAEAFVVNSIRNGGSGGNDFWDTSVKYFRTADGKEIRFSPEGITISCSGSDNEKTGEKNIIYIDLKDNNGISITSTKHIHINLDLNLK